MLTNEKVQDPRARRTRQVLQQAFLELLMRESFEAVTVKDITERAEVNRATFYAHFDDKYALLDATIHAIFTNLLQKRLGGNVVTCPADLEQVVLAVCDFLCQFDGACRRMERRFEVLVEKEIKALVAELLQTWLSEADSQQWPDGMSAELAAVTASWAIYGGSLHWSRQNPRPPVDGFTHSMSLLIAEDMLGVVIEPKM